MNELRQMLNSIIDTHMDAGVGPDPGDIASKTIEDIPSDMYRDVALYLLPDMIRHRYRERRTSKTRHQPRKISDGKWSDTIERNIMEEAWSTENGYRKVADLTLGDVKWIASDYRTRAAELEVWASRFVKLGAAMKRAKAEVVGDLDIDLVARILDGDSI